MKRKSSNASRNFAALAILSIFLPLPTCVVDFLKFPHLVLLVAVFLPWFWVLSASPCDVWVSGGQTKGIEQSSQHTSANANVQWNQLYEEKQILNEKEKGH